jgi:nicotinamide-nucleotide amidase
MTSDGPQDAARAVADAARGSGRTVVAAESVTAGSIATALAAAHDASDWFRGSVVAYQTDMKREVLGVTADDVITRECAVQMAEGALRLSGADLAVAVTGVGGPDPEAGHPAGTVIIAAGSRRGLTVFDHHIEGEPAEVVRQATLHALRHLSAAASGLAEAV